MANYLILIHRDQHATPPAGVEDISAPYREFMEHRAGALRGGAALEDAKTALSVRADEHGAFVVTDGPFAESKEVLGGYYVIEAADQDEALEIAKEVPAPAGGVVVWPIRLMS